MNASSVSPPKFSSLRVHARSLGKTRARIWLLAFLTLFTVSFLLLTWWEAIRYTSEKTRVLFLLILGSQLLLAGAGALIIRILAGLRRLPGTGDISLARALGTRDHEVGDRILTGVQLERQTETQGISDALRHMAIHRSDDLLRSLPEDLLREESRLRKQERRFWRILAGVLVLLLGTFTPSYQALVRIAHPGIIYPYPLPMSLSLKAESNQILAGDTIVVQGRLNGRKVSQLRLEQATRRDTTLTWLQVEGDSFRWVLPGAFHSLDLQASVTNRRFWEPWSEIRSDPLHITVINRPVIQDLTLSVHPPSYSRLPVEMKRQNILDIRGLPGSRVQLDGRVSKEIAGSQLIHGSGESDELWTEGNHFRARFTLSTEEEIHLVVVDDEGVTNLDPPLLPIHLLPDVGPLAKILAPGEDVLLGENLTLPLVIKLDDDFGFSKAELHYRRQAPEYLQADTNAASIALALPREGEVSLQFPKLWDLNDLGLGPEDVMEYWVEVWDNNDVAGPQRGVSNVWTARFPSLTELFEETEEVHQQARENTAEILETVKEIQEKVDQLALEVTKDPNMSWEQQQATGEAMEQMQDLEESLQQISQELDNMLEMAEEQALFSEETLQQYRKLQELMQELITPEMIEAMERLRNAMEDQDPGEMQAAMQDFQAAMEDFERSVERTLEIFQQVALEQTLDELASRLEDLASRQEALNEGMASDSSNSAELAGREEQLQQDFEQTRDVAQDLADMLDQQPQLDAAPLAELQTEMSTEEIPRNLQAAQSMLQQGQQQQARPVGQQIQQSLENLSQMAMQMQQNMQQQMMDQVLGEFRAVMMKTLALSQAQERLETDTRSTPRHSSNLRDRAQKQVDLQGGLQSIATDLTTLGERTFAVSGTMGRLLGKSMSSMQEAVRELEQRDPRQAAQAQQDARKFLNSLARQMASSMQSLQQSGQSSGFQQYMEQLQQMAGNQQGLNEQTMMQLGAGNMSLLQQLAERQMAMRESLRQIEEGMGEDGRMLGDLGKIGEEMEAVAKELKKRSPSPRVLKQQERILSRLLDAQRSAHQRDFSKKRKSETGKIDAAWMLPDSLPTGLGEARDLLYEELLHSLRQGYSMEDQALIREYFQHLEEALQ